jgi:hypothetical protein
MLAQEDKICISSVGGGITNLLYKVEYGTKVIISVAVAILLFWIR